MGKKCRDLGKEKIRKVEKCVDEVLFCGFFPLPHTLDDELLLVERDIKPRFFFYSSFSGLILSVVLEKNSR